MEVLVDLADKLHSVDRAAALIKRYKQLEWEAKILGLEPLPAPQVPPEVMGAYVLIVGRKPHGGAGGVKEPT
jgi:hypothetical protein